MSAPADRVLDALGNQVRREILTMLTNGPLSVSDIAEKFPVSRPAISRHLSQLTDAGLLTHSPNGTQNLYRINHTGFASAEQWLNAFWGDAEARLRIVAENTFPQKDT